ncbi:MAG: hypothetical protein GWP09_02025 [Nitrospiraceae bacterium]|nr:hypothetical protein [Nitrospiraceae bacterium]
MNGLFINNYRLPINISLIINTYNGSIHSDTLVYCSYYGCDGSYETC